MRLAFAACSADEGAKEFAYGGFVEVFGLVKHGDFGGDFLHQVAAVLLQLGLGLRFAGDDRGAVGAAFDGDFFNVEAQGGEFELHGVSPFVVLAFCLAVSGRLVPGLVIRCCLVCCSLGFGFKGGGCFAPPLCHPLRS